MLSRIGAFALIAMIAGCGGTSFETVSGKVTLDGAPLPKAKVLLVPKNPPPNSSDPNAKGPYIGVTDDQGQFEIGLVGDTGGGVPTGTYTLAISTAWLDGGDETSITPPQKVPAPHSTGVDFEVPQGGTDAANFDLKSK
jgi:hypothetical protein